MQSFKPFMHSLIHLDITQGNKFKKNSSGRIVEFQKKIIEKHGELA